MLRSPRLRAALSAALLAPCVAVAGDIAESRLLPAEPELEQLLPGAAERGVELGGAWLYALPFYGPEVYLLWLQLSWPRQTLELAVADYGAYPLLLRDGETRWWGALVRLPGDTWPADGRPQVLAPLPQALAPVCADTAQALRGSHASQEEMGWPEDAMTGDPQPRLQLAPWQRDGQPVLIMGARTSSAGSGGGSHYEQRWYLYGAAGESRLAMLACVPAASGYWFKASFDARGRLAEPGGEHEVTWDLLPGAGTVDALRLQERIDGGRPRDIAGYRWNGREYEIDPAR